jgi:putative heme degradation protein
MLNENENIERQKAIKILMDRWAQKKDTNAKATLLQAMNKKQKPDKPGKKNNFR